MVKQSPRSFWTFANPSVHGIVCSEIHGHHISGKRFNGARELCVAGIPMPRIRMLDGFNEGWIEFEGGNAAVMKGEIELTPPPAGPDTWLYDSGFFIPDPWAMDAFSDIDPAEPLLLIGSGLTTVDIALRLHQQGHRGPLLALSRRGLTPRTHAAGGAWPEFLHDKIPASALALTKIVRDQIALAASRGIAWQRVFDAARPAVPSIWNGWSQFSRRQFLRHLRTRWASASKLAIAPSSTAPGRRLPGCSRSGR